MINIPSSKSDASPCVPSSRKLPDTPEAIMALWLGVQADLRRYYARSRALSYQATWEAIRARSHDIPPWDVLVEAAAANKRHNKELGEREHG